MSHLHPDKGAHACAQSQWFYEELPIGEILRLSNRLQLNSTTSSMRRRWKWSTGTHTRCRRIRPTTGSSPYTNGRISVRRRRAEVHTVGTSTNDSSEPSPTSTWSTRCTSCRYRRAREDSRRGHVVTGSRRRGCTSEVVQCRRSRLVERPSQSGVRHFWNEIITSEIRL